jgi:hypothetical protein
MTHRLATPLSSSNWSPLGFFSLKAIVLAFIDCQSTLYPRVTTDFLSILATIMTTPLASLTLFKATPRQILESRYRTHPAWGRGLCLEDYLQRDPLLDGHEHATGKLTTWYARDHQLWMKGPHWKPNPIPSGYLPLETIPRLLHSNALARPTKDAAF